MIDRSVHSVSVAGVTFDDAGRVLVIKRRDSGEWQAPGGVLELEESFESGVVREVLEETGVRVRVETLTGVYKNMSRAVVALVYRCSPIGGQAIPSEEAAEVVWVSVEDATARMTTAFGVRIVDAAKSNGIMVPSRLHDGVHLL